MQTLTRQISNRSFKNNPNIADDIDGKEMEKEKRTGALRGRAKQSKLH